MAQLVARLPPKEQVAGSRPVVHSIGFFFHSHGFEAEQGSEIPNVSLPQCACSRDGQGSCLQSRRSRFESGHALAVSSPRSSEAEQTTLNRRVGISKFPGGTSPQRIKGKVRG